MAPSQRNNFRNSKNQALGKRDKSSAGRIDPQAVQICAEINKLDRFFTTSSCSGRCYLYRGHAVKISDSFERFRVSHDLVDASYFDLAELLDFATKEEERESINKTSNRTLWLRFEPFILHIACRSLQAAGELMNAARPSFKNVGLTTWKDSRHLVAIWGDEGLEMPLTDPSGRPLFGQNKDWLAQLVNERHERNWSKIDRFVKAVRELPVATVENNLGEPQDDSDHGNGPKIPRSYDVIGDIALLHSISTENPQEQQSIGEVIMKKNKAIKIVVLRGDNLGGTERAAGQLKIIAGAQRAPLLTSHREYGIKCVIDLEKTFFSPRMGPERLRICQQVGLNENVLVLFAGVCMDALQIAARTQANSILAIELNEDAVNCGRKGHRLLVRNKAVKVPGAAERLEIVQGDVLNIASMLEKESFDRILAPRPKEGRLDGDLGSGDGGLEFLRVFLPLLKPDGGECHFYDFCADHEFPECARTKTLLTAACREHGLTATFLHVANVGSVAMRQLRVCVDFRLSKA